MKGVRPSSKEHKVVRRSPFRWYIHRDGQCRIQYKPVRHEWGWDLEVEALRLADLPDHVAERFGEVWQKRIRAALRIKRRSYIAFKPLDDPEWFDARDELIRNPGNEASAEIEALHGHNSPAAQSKRSELQEELRAYRLELASNEAYRTRLFPEREIDETTAGHAAKHGL